MTHSFLLVPDCPYPLLGRDLLSKVGAQIHFHKDGASVTGSGGQSLQVLTLNLEDEYWLHEYPQTNTLPLDPKRLTDFPQAWAETAGIGLAVSQPPLIIDLKPSASPVPGFFTGRRGVFQGERQGFKMPNSNSLRMCGSMPSLDSLLIGYCRIVTGEADGCKSMIRAAD